MKSHHRIALSAAVLALIAGAFGAVTEPFVVPQCTDEIADAGGVCIGEPV